MITVHVAVNVASDVIGPTNGDQPLNVKPGRLGSDGVVGVPPDATVPVERMPRTKHSNVYDTLPGIIAIQVAVKIVSTVIEPTDGLQPVNR